jgi:hypothetical protein
MDYEEQVEEQAEDLPPTESAAEHVTGGMSIVTPGPGPVPIPYPNASGTGSRPQN